MCPRTSSPFAGMTRTLPVHDCCPSPRFNYTQGALAGPFMPLDWCSQGFLPPKLLDQGKRVAVGGQHLHRDGQTVLSK